MWALSGLMWTKGAVSWPGRVIVYHGKDYMLRNAANLIGQITKLQMVTDQTDYYVLFHHRSWCTSLFEVYYMMCNDSDNWSHKPTFDNVQLISSVATLTFEMRTLWAKSLRHRRELLWIKKCRTDACTRFSDVQYRGMCAVNPSTVRCGETVQYTASSSSGYRPRLVDARGRLATILTGRCADTTSNPDTYFESPCRDDDSCGYGAACRDIQSHTPTITTHRMMSVMWHRAVSIN